jgi:hypothetical protein
VRIVVDNRAKSDTIFALLCDTQGALPSGSCVDGMGMSVDADICAGANEAFFATTTAAILRAGCARFKDV